MSKKVDQRVKITKLLLKNSLIDLLYEKDISKITIKEICKKADINRSTFYSHYSDSYDLLDNIREEYLNKIIKEVPMDEMEFNDTNEAIMNILNYISENMKLSKLLIGEKGDVNFQKRIMGLIYDDLQVKLMEITGISETKAKYISSYVITGSIGVLQDWINNDLNQPVEVIAEVISDLSTSVIISIGQKHGINMDQYL